MAVGSIALVFLVGLVVGLVSGLIGIGGGVLLVPFLYFYFAHPELFGVSAAPGVATVVAHATSLFVIVPTSMRGAFAYHRGGLVVWRAALPIGVASVVAAIVGAAVSPHIRPEMLRVAFGFLLLYSGVRLVWSGSPVVGEEAEARPLRLSPTITIGSGILVGAFSALLGVGGGIIAIPLLIHLVGVEMRRVAATSLGIIAITSLAGVLTYATSGLGVPGRPPTAVGYVDLAVGTVLFLGAIASVGAGARLNQRIRPRILMLLFASFFIAMGLYLIVLNLFA